MDDNHELRLTPFQITNTWIIIYNTFWEIDPVIENGEFINAAYFGENLLRIEMQIWTDPKWPSFYIHLGWYPSQDVEGSYQITLGIQGKDETLKTYSSKARLKIVDKLEQWLQIAAAHPFELDYYGPFPASLEFKGKAIGYLTPLRIPGGWYIMQNTFLAIEPIIAIGKNFLIGEDGEIISAEDDFLAMAQIVSQNSDQLPFFIDLGWCPSKDLEGTYLLTVGTSWEDEDHKTFISTDRLEIVDRLEQWLQIISLHPSNKDVADLLQIGNVN